jgi:CBS domain-containing protein
MARVAEILAAKGRGGAVRCTTPDTTAHAAISQMVQFGVGSLLVLEGREVVGIFTERDYLRSVVMQDRDARATRVRDVMTTRIVCVEPMRTLEDCMAIMTQQRFRHLPVMDGDELVGVISIGDLVKFLSNEREVELRYLTEYITGRY